MKERPYPWYSKTNAHCPGRLSLVSPSSLHKFNLLESLSESLTDNQRICSASCGANHGIRLHLALGSWCQASSGTFPTSVESPSLWPYPLFKGTVTGGARSTSNLSLHLAVKGHSSVKKCHLKSIFLTSIIHRLPFI